MAPGRLPLVRLADKGDEQDVLAMCRRLHAENGLFSLNEDKVRATIARYYDRQGVILGVIGPPGRLEASTCLMLSDFYYTADWHLAELWNFVEQPYRRSHNAEALVQFGKSCADQMKMPLFTGIITNKQLAGKVRLYRRMLGPPTGAFFVYNAPHWRTEPMEDRTELRGRLCETSDTVSKTPKPRWDDTQPLGKAKRKLLEDTARLHAQFTGLAPLFKEAADAIEEVDNFWGTTPRKSKVGAG